MKKITLLCLALILFLPLSILADGTNKKRKKKKPVVRKTAAVTKKAKRKPVQAVVKQPASNSVEVWPRCSTDSKNLVVTIYFKKVFHESVRIGSSQASLSEQDSHWRTPVNGWNGLKDQKPLKALYESLAPKSIEVYPGHVNSNSAVVNQVVLIRDQWFREDLLKIREIMADHIKDLGFEMSFTDWECILPNQSALATVRILQ